MRRAVVEELEADRGRRRQAPVGGLDGGGAHPPVPLLAGPVVRGLGGFGGAPGRARRFSSRRSCRDEARKRDLKSTSDARFIRAGAAALDARRGRRAVPARPPEPARRGAARVAALSRRPPPAPAAARRRGAAARSEMEGRREVLERRAGAAPAAGGAGCGGRGSLSARPTAPPDRAAAPVETALVMCWPTAFALSEGEAARRSEAKPGARQTRMARRTQTRHIARDLVQWNLAPGRREVELAEHRLDERDDEGEDHQLDADGDGGADGLLGEEPGVLRDAEGDQAAGQGDDEVVLDDGDADLAGDDEEGSDEDDVADGVEDAGRRGA